MNKREINFSCFPSGKRGQVYLIAAMVIIAVLIGFATISNYSGSKVPAGITNLKNILEIESWKVLDYSVVHGSWVVDNFTKEFADYSGEDIEIVYITGEENFIEAYKYNESVKEPVGFTREGNIAKVNYNGVEYDFELNTGMNFHFIIAQQVGGEQYIVTSKDE